MMEFHHIGVACRSFERDVNAFSIQGYRPEGEEFQDSVQGIRGQFLIGGGPRLELVAPLEKEDGVLADWLKRGAKFYHLAYLTDNLEKAIEDAQAGGAKVVVSPVPAVAFDGRKIAFLMQRNMSLIEYIEAEI